MIRTTVPDSELLEVVEAFRKHGNFSAASRALKMDRTTFRGRYYTAERRGLHLSDGARDVLTQTKVAPGEAQLAWRRVPGEDGSFNTVLVRFPAMTPETFADQVRAALEDIPTARPSAKPGHVNADLLNLIPITDAHIGLMSWQGETGTNWDTKSGAQRLADWTAEAIDRMPAAKTCIILSAGDLLHADSHAAETPASKHRQDVDTRFPRSFGMALSAMIASVNYALTRHEEVIVSVIPGNHDPNATIGIRNSMAAHFRNEPRARVRMSASEFFVHQFGKNMFVAHHGHRAQPAQLAHFAADEFSAIWGKTQHRYLFTGHRHELKAKDIHGMQWEQLPALTERDAWSYGGAFAGRARLCGITFHRESGRQSSVEVRGATPRKALKVYDGTAESETA